VVVCHTVPEALDTVTRMIEQQVFGDAGSASSSRNT